VLRHTGYVHRWAARHIAERPEAVLDGPSEEEILRGGAPDAELLAWFRSGHAALVETLAQADPDLVCGIFMAAPSPLAFWARRQAYETAIHRADAEIAAGTWPEYPADFAADGIDELITGFGQRRRYRPSADTGGSMQVRTTDTSHAWRIAPQDGRIHAHPDPDPDPGSSPAAGDRGPGPGPAASLADCVVSGPASGLYLFLWNRGDAAQSGVTVSGDPALFQAWQSSVRVRWD
jgi:uncharacterized protein (TIGR03083 family)